MEIVCPKPLGLSEIPETDCPSGEILGQIQRLAFQVTQSSASFADEATIKAQSSWTALLGLPDLDPAKIALSPIGSGVVIPPSEQITAGGDDNSTFRGIPDLFGEGFVQVTGMFKNISTETANALKELTQLSLNEPNPTCLTVFLLLEKKKIAANKDDAGGYFGIPVYNFRISSVGTEGNKTNTMRNFSFVLPECWDDQLDIVVADFDPVAL